MLIRSQDKKSTTTDLNLNIYQDDWVTGHYDISNETVGVIGTYSTEEKAIKVLDMIEHTYIKNVNHIIQPNFEVTTLPSNCVFQMPKDEDVEV